MDSRNEGRWIDLEHATLDELESQWREDDDLLRDFGATRERVRRAQASDDFEEIAGMLAAVERHWRGHRGYARLRDALLTRLGELQALDEKRLAQHHDDTRRLFAAQAWADRQLAELHASEQGTR